MSAPIPFPYPHDGGQPFRESLRFSTDILPSYSTREQRIPQRGFPGGMVEYSIMRVNAVGGTEVFGLLWAHAADQWLVALWPYAVRTSADVGAGDSFLPCVLPAAGYGLEVVPFQIAPSQAHPYLLVYQSPDNYQVLQYDALATLYGWGDEWDESWGESESDDPAGVHVLDAIQGSGTGWGLGWDEDWGDTTAGDAAFPAGSLVVPLRLARLDEEQASSLESLEATGGRVRWILEDTAD